MKKLFHTAQLSDKHCELYAYKAAQAKAWRMILTSEFFYIQDGIWKWHCFNAETWQKKEKIHYHYYYYYYSMGIKKLHACVH